MFKNIYLRINAIAKQLTITLFVLMYLPNASVFAGNFTVGSADGSFESGLSGMTVQGDVSIASSLGTLKPTQGSNAVLLTTGPDQGSLLSDADVSVFTIESFSIPADADTLRLDYNFLTNEPIPSFTNDNLVISLILVTAGGEQQLLSFDTFNEFYDAPWTGYAKQSGFRVLVADVSTYAGTSDTFTLQVRVADVGDGRGDSAVFLDNLQFSVAGEPLADANIVYTKVDPDEKILFDASTTTDDGSITEYRWDFGNGFIGIGRLVEFSYPEEGIYQVRLFVTDDEGNVTTKDFQVVVGDINHSPSIVSTANTVAVENVNYQYQPVVSDPELGIGDVMTFSLTTAPAGMSIDENTGLISWLPTAGVARKNTVTVEVADSFGLTASQTYTVTIGSEIYVAAADDNGRIYFARSNGDGSFSGFQQIGDSGSNSRGSAIADFDGDGDFDVISGHSASSRIHLYLYQREDNKFLPPAYLGQTGSSSLSPGTWLMDLAAEDFNNDGNMDYLVNGDSANTWLYLNQGSLDIVEEGFFTSDFEEEDAAWGGAYCNTVIERDASTSASGNFSMRVFATGSSCMSADINPSGWSLASGSQMTFAYRIPNGVPAGLLFNVSGKGWIFLGGSPAATPGPYSSVAAAQLIDDGQWHTVTINLYDAIRQVWPDATTITEFEWYTSTNASAGAEFWFDDFSITRRVVQSGFVESLMPNGGGNGRGMDAADVNSDGNMDFVRGRSDAQVFYYQGDGTGSFTISSSAVADPGHDGYGVVLGDFDNDGIVDLIANNNGSGDPYFYRGKDNGTFIAGVYVPTLDTNNYTSYGVYDFNNDGNLDIVAANYSHRQLWFYPGNGNATFGARTLIGTTAGNVLSVAAPAGRKIGQPFSLFTADKQELSEGGSVHFDATSSYDDGTVVQYAWDFADGSTATGVQVDHVFASEGNHVVVLTITDDEGNKDVSSKKIIVKGQAPVANAGSGYQVGEDKAIKGQWSVLFDGSASADLETSISRYEWDFDATDGVSVDATGVSPVHVYPAVGTYTVTLTVYDEVEQAHSVTTQVLVQGGAAPVATLNGPATIDEAAASLGEWNAVFDFSSSTDDLGISRYNIDWGDGSTSVINSLKENFEDQNISENPLWTVSGGTWQTIDGQLHQTNTSGGWNWLQDLTQSYRDFELEVDFKGVSTNNGYMGIAFRKKNTSGSTDTFLMYSRDSWNYWTFLDWKTNAALQNSLAGTGWDPGIWYHLRLVVVGNNMKLYVTPEGGTEELQLDVHNPNHSFGGIALLAHTQSLVYDNLTVTPIGDSLIANHTFAATGDYDVSLTVTDHADQSHTVTQTLQVQSNSEPVANHGGPYLLNEGDARNGYWNLVLDMGGSTDDHNVQRYHVDFGDGTSYTTAYKDGSKGSFFVTGTDIYGYDIPDARLGRIIATEDATEVQVINLETGAVIATNTLNRFNTWDVSPGDGVYFKVKANKPVVAYETDFGSHSAFIPSMDTSPLGNEFIFHKRNSQGFYVYAFEDAQVRFLDKNDNVIEENFVAAGSYWKPVNLNQIEYRAVSSGKIAMQTSGNNGYTTVPSETGDGAGKLFYFATEKGSTGAVAVFAHEASDVEVLDLDTGELLYSQTINAGESWFQNGIGIRRLKLVSSALVEVWAGDTEGGTGILDLGDGISMAGGKDGKEYYLHNLQDGIVIFAPNQNTQITIDAGDIVKTLARDEFLHLTPLDFPAGSGVHHIVASQPIVIQSLGRANTFNDMGTYLGGVSARHGYTTAGVYPLKVTAIDNAGQSHTTETTVTVEVNDPPEADIAAPAVLSEGIAAGGKWPVDFDASGSTDDFGISRYEWDFGDGKTGTGVTAHHEYEATGTYTVSLTVTDHVGQQTVKTFSISVEASNPPVANSGGPYVFGEESATFGIWTATLDATGSTDDEGIFDYVWALEPKLDDFFGTQLDAQKWLVSGNVSQNNAAIVTGAGSWSNRYIFSSSTFARNVGDVYTAQVLPENTSGNQYGMWGLKNSSSTNYHYNQMPYAIYFANNSVFIYENGASRGSKGTYTRGVLYDIRITLKAQGAVYEYKAATETDWVVLYDSNFSSETNLRFGGAIHSGTFHLDNVLTPPERLFGAVVSKQFFKPQVVGVTLTVRDNALQASSDSTTITIANGDAPIAKAGGPYQVEVGTFINFNGSASTDDNAIEQYHWTFGDSTGGPGDADLPYVGKGATPRHFYRQPGTYDVELKVTDNALNMHTETTTVEVIVAGAPTAQAEIVGPGAVNGPPVYFSAEKSSDDFAIIEYRWDFDDTVDKDGDGNFTNDIDAVGARPFHTYSKSTGSLSETFDASDINQQTWTISDSGFTQANGLLTVSGSNSWTRGFYSNQTFGRDPSKPITGEVHTESGTTQHMMWGLFKQDPSSFSYTQMPHAIYFNNGGVNIYEDGSHRGQVGTYTKGLVYDVRIDVKESGADYFIREKGASDWTQLTSYTSLNRSSTPLRVGASHHSGKFDFDNIQAQGIDNFKVTLTVEDGAGQTSSAEIPVTVAVNLPPDVITVPWVPHDLLIPHETFNGKSIRLKGIVRDADAKTYQWDFGDGTQSAVLNVTNTYDLSIAHTYPNAPAGTPFVATLKVWDSAGQQGEDQYNIVVKNKTLNTEINVAIDEGLWYLHQTQTRTTAEGFPTGYWISNARASATASALQAFEINAHLETVDPRIDPYQENVQRGLRQLFRDLGKVTIGVQTYGEPDTNGNGFGLETGVNGSGGRPIYQGGQVMDAIASSGTPLARAVTGGEGINRRSYFDILTDMSDQYAWGQTEQGSGGGWRYSWNSAIDNSAAQWGAIGMLASQDVFGIPVPQWVKDRNQVWLNRSYSGQGWGYTSGVSSAGTPSGLVQMILDDQTTADPRWKTAEKWMADNWNSEYLITPGNRPYYQYYALAKSMRLAKPAAVVKFESNGFDWFNDPVEGLARTLVDDQQSNGQFPGSVWITQQLRSAWGVIILSQTLFVQPPVADAGRDRVWAVDLPLEFDGSNSFHLDPFRSIVKYEWDFDNDGVFDFVSDTPTATHTYPLAKYPESSLPQTIHAQLRVTDNNIPPLTDSDDVEIIIAIPPHPPIADAGDSYTCTQGVPCLLDGGASFDIDPTDFIARYEWELDNIFPFDFDEASGEQPLPIFDSLGNQNIGLRVWDNGVLNDIDNDGEVDENERLSDQHFVLVNVVANLDPVADANGLYTVDEGSSITLDASGSTDPNNDTLFFDWDFDSDGVFDDASGVAPTFTGVDDAVVAVSVLVSDSVLSDISSSTITVNNVAPSVDAGADQTVVEGDSVSFIGSFIDPGTLDTHTMVWDFGDGTPTVSGTLVPSHIYPENGVYTVTLTVTDDDGGVGVDTLVVNVNNADPVVDAGADQMINEGDSVSLLPALFTDAGVQDTHTAVIDWGDGSPTESGVLLQGAGSGTVAADHTYPENGVFTVTVKLTDDDGGVGEDSFIVTVNNLAPVVDAGADQSALTGQSIVLDPATFTDAGVEDTHAATIDWGDGSAVESGTVTQGAGSGSVAGSHSYGTAGSYTVTVTVTDDDGGVGSDTFVVAIGLSNQPPTADAGGPYTVPEGDNVVLSAAGSSDPDSQPLSYAWDLDNDGQYDDGTGATISFAGVDDGVYTVGVSVSDGLLSDTATAQVTVTNEKPVVDAGADQSALTGQSIVLDPATFTDAGVEDTHTATIDWGDGSAVESGPVTQGVGSGSVAGSHSYGTASSYTVTVTVTDDDGGVGSDTFVVAIGLSNQPPTADAGGPYTVPEGDNVVLSAAGSSDPDSQPLSYAWDLDNDGQYDDGTGATISFAGVDDGVYTVGVSVSDGLLSDTATAQVTVTNENPVVDAGADQSALTGQSIVLDPATFTDAGVEDTHTATIDWGDGSAVESGPVTQGVGSGSVAGSHSYGTASSYTVTVTVTDDDGGVGSDTFVVAVDDPVVPVQTIFDLYARAKDSKLDLVWTPVTGADTYNVYRSTNAGGPYDLISSGHTCNYCAYADFNLINGVTYYYVVTSINAGVESLSSNEAFATPKAAARTRRRR